ncbi:hypothetical protein PPE_00253 [Paenibacillus polymyxa E681]|nr:hypothetical protein PPE_00253 [Paenibacillus polymyxa E681]
MNIAKYTIHGSLHKWQKNGMVIFPLMLAIRLITIIQAILRFKYKCLTITSKPLFDLASWEPLFGWHLITDERLQVELAGSHIGYASEFLVVPKSQ